MIVIQKAMEKSGLYNIDEYGVKNYNYYVLGVISISLLAFLNVTLGGLTFLAELEATNSPVQSLSDSIWLMLMSSTTIGFGDVYPVTFIGRACVFMMFVLGVGILGAVGAIFANKILGFADTNIKNRELKKQNAEIYQQNSEIYEKLIALEKKLDSLEK